MTWIIIDWNQIVLLKHLEITLSPKSTPNVDTKTKGIILHIYKTLLEMIRQPDDSKI